MAQVIETAEQSAGGAKVRRVVLEIGRLACVMPDSLRFAFECLREGTALADADLEIVEIQGRGRCRACGTLVVMDELWAECSCGEVDLEIVEGNDLVLRRLEVQ